MNIGIDVDGTLIDIGKYMLEKGEKYFHRAASEPAAFDIEEMFACTHKERNRFWARYLLPYCIKSPMIDGAGKTIRQLRADGHKIFMVTSRVYTTRTDLFGALFRTILVRWLKKRGVIYDGIVFCEDSGEAKSEQCQKLEIDIMIDDKPDNLMAISRHCSVIACPAPWNKGIADKGVVRAENWADIYDIITGGQT